VDLSIVIPLYNEEESLPDLESWIRRVVEERKYTYEILFVDDGSRDGSWNVIEGLCDGNKNAKGIKFQRNYGKSAALNEGFTAAMGDVIITMDADMQDSPDEIPGIYNMIKDGGFDVVSGWKKKRYDPIMKTIPSKFFNWITRVMSGIKLHDFNCGLKAYRKSVVKSIEVYGEMHRYIPVLARKAGFYKIGEKEVEHRARQYGVSKFGLERFINGFLDLLSVLFITKFGKRPMHLFGVLGTLMFIVGFGAAVWLGAQKLYFLQQGISARLVTDNPIFFIGLACMILGTQLFLAGFLGELVSRNAADRDNYLIETKSNLK